MNNQDGKVKKTSQFLKVHLIHYNLLHLNTTNDNFFAQLRLTGLLYIYFIVSIIILLLSINYLYTLKYNLRVI